MQRKSSSRVRENFQEISGWRNSSEVNWFAFPHFKMRSSSASIDFL